MTDIKEKLHEYYKNITEIFNQDNDSPKLLHKKQNINLNKNEELITGIIVTLLIITIIISTLYYFIIFSPQQEELNNLKQEKINTVTTLLGEDEDHNREAIIAEIESKNTIEELNLLDVESMAHPLLKNKLLEQVKQYKDKYNRIEIVTDNTTDIMNINNATNYINTQDPSTLSLISIKPVDSVIIPLSINRKQAASGFLTQSVTVDIYKTKQTDEIPIESDAETEVNNTTHDVDKSTKIVGGSTVISILRSKDSGNIDENIDLSETPNPRNITQTSSLDIQEILSSKAAGTYDEKQIKVLLDEYGVRLSDYERTSNIGDLDVEYIIMVEVPRSSVESLIENMDNIILTIPTYDAPSWVKL